MLSAFGTVQMQEINTDKFVSDSYKNYEALRDVSCL
jgi:hypothetical protein